MDFLPQCLLGGVKGSVDPVEISILFGMEAEGIFGLFLCLPVCFFSYQDSFCHATPQELHLQVKVSSSFSLMSYHHRYLCQELAKLKRHGLGPFEAHLFLPGTFTKNLLCTRIPGGANSQSRYMNPSFQKSI